MPIVAKIKNQLRKGRSSASSGRKCVLLTALACGALCCSLYGDTVWLPAVDPANWDLNLSGEITNGKDDPAAVVYTGGDLREDGVITSTITLNGGSLVSNGSSFAAGIIFRGFTNASDSDYFKIQLAEGSSDVFQFSATVLGDGLDDGALGIKGENMDYFHFDPNGLKVIGNFSSTGGAGFLKWFYQGGTANYVTVGNFGAETVLTAEADYNASVFGYSSYTSSFDDPETPYISNWTIGNFGEGSQLSATGEYATVFGATDMSYHDGQLFNNWTIGDFGAGSELSASGNLATVFGATDVFNCEGELFNDWTIGDFGEGVVLQAAGIFEATVFGAASFGENGNEERGSFNGWKIGNFGEGAVLVASAEYDDWVGAIIFGHAYTDYRSFMCFNDWTIGDFASGAVLSSSAVGSGAFASVAVFGGDNWESSCYHNWSVQFTGSADITAVGCADYTRKDSVDTHTCIGTLGGTCNGMASEDPSTGMRFYFNNVDENNPATVNLIGANLTQDGWTLNEEDSTASATLSESDLVWGDDDSWVDDNNVVHYSAYFARAVALGANFQLNIGRARTLGEEVQDNGTWELADSIANGGTTSGYSGTLNVIGAMALAPDGYKGFIWEQVALGSVMRIDSGWTVNAYSPILNWETIEILDGKLVLMDRDLDVENLAAVLSETTVKVAGTDGTLYSGTLNAGKYPIWGALALRNDDQTVRFGTQVVTSANGSQLQEKGQIEIHGSGPVNLDGPVEPPVPYEVLIGWRHPAIIFVDEPTFELVVDKSNLNELSAGVNCQLVKAGDKNCFYGLEFDDEEEPDHAGYYKVLSGVRLDHDLTDYISGKNLDLYYVEGEGLVASTLDEDIIVEPTDYAREYVNAELATSVTVANNLTNNNISAILCDVKGNGNDPVVAVLGAHSHQDEIAGFGYSNNIWGILLGEDYTLDLGHDRHLLVGAAASFAKSKIDFFGSATGLGKNASQNMYIGGLFAAYERFNRNHLKTNINAWTGINYSKNRMNRTDSTPNHYWSDFNALNYFLFVNGVKNFAAYQGWQMGPWCSVGYNYSHQHGYTEQSNGGTDAVTLSSIDQNLLEFILGVNLEKEWQHQQKADARLRTYARAGWRCQPIRSHSTGEARISGLNPFVPEFGYAERNGFVAQLGLRNKLDQNWEWSANYAADISGNYRYQNLNLSVGYTF